MTSLFYETLRRAELDHYYPSFERNGVVDLADLVHLSMQDFSNLGIHSRDDREKLFHLINHIRIEYPSGGGNSGKGGVGKSGNTTGVGLRNPARDAATGTSSSFIPRPGSVSGAANLAASAIPSVQGRAVSASISGFAGARSNRSNTVASSSATSSVSHFSHHHGRSLDDTGNVSSMAAFMYEEDPPEPVKKTKAAPMLDAYGVPLEKARVAGKNRELQQKIRVCVRKRPLNQKELGKGESDIIEMRGRKAMTVNEPKIKLDLSKYVEEHQFMFDEVFREDEDNEAVYQRTALPLVEYVFEGGKATCFAYGQTGSGKTHTMLDLRTGLYVLAARDMFFLLSQPEYKHLTAFVSFFEIYQGQLYDLLNGRKKLFAREDGKQRVVIVGIQEFQISSVDNLLEVFEYGSNNRSTGSTGANADSSRSHAILQIAIKHRQNKKKLHGKFSFIDLAGSERGADRGDTNQQTRIEGAEINKSLLALKECIRALDQNKRHLPFRQSKLTQVLKDSFMGKSRTCMIATISPSVGNSEHTLNTLRYADRVKELSGDAGNEEDEAMLYSEPAPVSHGASKGASSKTSALRPPRQRVAAHGAVSSAGGPTASTIKSNQLLRQSPALAQSPHIGSDHSMLTDPDLFENGFQSGDEDFLNEQYPPDDLIDNSGPEEYEDEETMDEDEDLDAEECEEEGEATEDVEDTAPVYDEPESTDEYRPVVHNNPNASSMDSSASRSARIAEIIKSRRQSQTAVPPNLPSRSIARPPPSSSSSATSGIPRPGSSGSISRFTRSNAVGSISTNDTQSPPSRGPLSAPARDGSSYFSTSNKTSSPPPANGISDVYTTQKMDEFIKKHRAQIREVTALVKQETQLMAGFTLSMSAEVNGGGDGAGTAKAFEEYLQKLSDVLDQKVKIVSELKGSVDFMLGG